MITIVGGSGFVGTKLINELSNMKIRNIDKRPSKLFNNYTRLCDIRDLSSLKFDPETDLVVHLAAEHKDDVKPVKLYYDVNVQGTKNLLKKMDDIGIKNLIFTSSVAIYGLNKKNPDENFQPDPFNHYGKSKFEAEKLIQEWYQKDPSKKSVIIIRPTVIFGEDNEGNVHNLFNQIIKKKFIMIGNGTNKKSMAYVKNVVSFIKNRINNMEVGFDIYNYSDKPDLSMQELVSIIEKKMNLKIPRIKIPYYLGMIFGYFFDLLAIILNKKLSISSVRIKKFCATTQFASSKSHKVFSPEYTIREGIVKTIDYEFKKKSV